jgi:ferredoxin-NADP reductase
MLRTNGLAAPLPGASAHTLFPNRRSVQRKRRTQTSLACGRFSFITDSEWFAAQEFNSPNNEASVERKLYTARLLDKMILSEPAQCFHLEFEVSGIERFSFAPGQFVSMVADDPSGKHHTRAYSIASAPRGNRFDLCVNRVENGFFSNLLCDLEPGAELQFHGPHGLFVLPAPLPHTLLIATGTGVAPMRGFVESLFPSENEDRSEGRHFWLLYGTRHETEIYYRRFFEKTAAEHPNFHYLPALSRPHEGWEGLRGYVQTHVRTVLENHPQIIAQEMPEDPAHSGMHAYICGLNEMVAANRELLAQLGWDRKQIHFERYD